MSIQTIRHQIQVSNNYYEIPETKNEKCFFMRCIEKIISITSKLFFSSPHAFKYVAYKIGMADKKTLQKIDFSRTAPWRANDYKQIDYKNKGLGFNKNSKYGNLYLGALPVHNRNMFNNLAGENGILKQGDLVVSLNEPWERKEMPNSNPVTKEQWKSKSITRLEFNAEDRKLVGFEALYTAGQAIKSALQSGNNAYVHCRAGKGRSAMAIAAALMMMGATPDTAAQIIKKSRPSSTIMEKLDDPNALREFYINLNFEFLSSQP